MKKRIYIIGVDIGTQGTKASLYRMDKTLLAEAFTESRLTYLENGGIIQDPEEMYASAVQTIQRIVRESGVSPDEVAGIGIDGQMAGIMAIDEEWNPVTCYDSWLDTRCTPYMEMMKAHEEDIIQITGGQVTCAHGPKILWWKEERPEIYQKIFRFIQPSSYVSGRLCGLKGENAFIDDTFLHFTGFADNENRVWSDRLLGYFDIAKEKMPRICRPTEIIGSLTKKAAEECGLDTGVCVAAGCGDTAACALGAGIVNPGMLYDVAGTASVFAAATDRYAPDKKHKTLLYARSALEDMWMPLAYLSGGGLCIRWASRLLGMEYNELEQLAAKVPWGCDGLTFVPHFAGMTCPNRREVQGGCTGLKWNQGPGHFYRSVLESIVYEYVNYLDILKESVKGLQTVGIYGVGGGTKNNLFNQMKADALGVSYYTLGNPEAATWGSAALAGVASGIIKDIREAVDMRDKYQKKYESNQEKNGICREYVLNYKRILNLT